jgi:Right handed beta helix region
MVSRLRYVAVACFFLLVGPARATEVTVNCQQPGVSIQAALNRLNPVGPHTIWVTGTCRGPVTIHQRDRLTIQAPDGQVATIDGGSDPYAIDIGGSRNVTLRRLAIEHGSDGISIHDDSLVWVEDCSVDNAANNGMVVLSNSTLSLIASTLEDNPGRGLRVMQGSQASLVGRGQSHVLIRGSDYGVYCTESSACLLDGLVTIEENNYGLAVTRSSAARVSATRGRNTVRRNWSAGILVNLNAFAAFSGTDVEENGLGFQVDQNSSLVVTDTAVRDNTGSAFSISLMAHVLFATGNVVAGNQDFAFECDVTSELVLYEGYAFMPRDLHCNNVWVGTEGTRPGDPRPGRIQ